MSGPPSYFAAHHGRAASARVWVLVAAMAAAIAVVGLVITGHLAAEPAAAALFSLGAVSAVVWLSTAPVIRAARADVEEIKAPIALLIEEMVNQPEDQHEIQEQLREKLREMRAMGLPLPADLVALEKRLDDDFYAAGT